MNFSPSFLRFPLGVLAGLALLIGCQSTSGPDPIPSTAMTANGSVGFADTLRLPDFGVWRTNNAARPADTGRGSVTCVTGKTDGKKDCSQDFALKAVLGSDLLVQDLYTLGVHFATFKYSQTGTVPQLTLLGDSIRLFAMEDTLIREFNRQYKGVRTPTASDLIAYYAKLLLDADPSVKDSALPKGMMADTVKKILVQVAAQSGVTAKALAAKAPLGLTDETMIRTITDVLIKSGVKIDTTKLYPSAPVWVVDSVKVASDLIEGEGEVAVSGAFAWEARAGVRRQIARVVTADGVEDENIRVIPDGVPDLSSGSWALTGHLTLQAKKGAKIGVDTLIVSVEGDSGKATSRTAFRVLPGDITPPTVSITQPSGDTDVVHGKEKITVVVQASDAKGIAEVKIGNAVLTTAPYSIEYDLAVGYNFIYVQAKDNAGNVSSDTVVVQRKRSTTSTDATNPVITLRSPAKDTTAVATGLPQIELSWTATDDVGIKRVTFNDSDVTGAAGAYTKTVALQDGDNTFEIKAFDDAGNAAKKSVLIQRPADQAKPGIAPASDRTVGAEVDTAILTWTITNSAKAVSATLNAKPVTVGATIRETVSLLAGNNEFILAIKDAKGYMVSDTVIVARAADVTGPSVVWVAPVKSASVEATMTSFAVQVKVTDASGVESVSLNGALTAKDAADVYAMNLALPKPDGNPIWVVVVAKDTKGNVTRDSVSVTRKAPDGTNKPIIKLLKPIDSVGNALKYEEPTLHVEADITDALLAIDAKSVLIGGVAATATDSVYAADVPVPATGTPTTIAIKATNTNGITSSLNVVVTRAKDAVKPVITPDSNTQTKTVAYGTKSVELSWTVTDNHKVVSLMFNGLEVPVAAIVKKTFNVAVGENKATLVAIDSAGNTASDTVVVTVAGDDAGPVLAITAPLNNHEIPYPATTVDVTAAATDAASGLASIKIGATICTSSPCVALGVAPDASNKITVVATDSAGKATTQSITVTVGKDKTAPVIKAGTGAADLMVENGIASQVVEWTVTDNGPLDAVTITNNGGPALSMTGTYKSTVNLVEGDNAIVINAKDAAGNSATALSFTIVRKSKVATPSFETVPGEVAPGTPIKLACATPSAVIKYALNTGATEYTYDAATGIVITADVTITAWATLANNTTSDKTAATKFTVKRDVTLKSITVDGKTLSLNGLTDSATLDLFKTNAVIVATANDANATISIDGTASKASPNSTPVTVSSTRSIAIKVMNGGATPSTYNVTLNVPTSGSITDSRSNSDDVAQDYQVKKVGAKWWMATNMNYMVTRTVGDHDPVYGSCDDPATCLTSGRSYSYYDAQKTCPSGWTLPSIADWGTVQGMESTLNLVTGNYWSSAPVSIESDGAQMVEGVVFSQRGNGVYSYDINGVDLNYVRCVKP